VMHPAPPPCFSGEPVHSGDQLVPAPLETISGLERTGRREWGWRAEFVKAGTKYQADTCGGRGIRCFLWGRDVVAVSLRPTIVPAARHMGEVSRHCQAQATVAVQYASSACGPFQSDSLDGQGRMQSLA